MRVTIPVLAALLVLALLAPAARATTLVASEDGPVPGRLSAWLIASEVPFPVASVVVHSRSCAETGGEGCALEVDGIPNVWVDPNAKDARAIFLHELGHAFDYEVMTDAARAAFLRTTHDHRAWRSPPNSPNEQFAEAYSLCARQRAIRRPPVEWSYLYRPGPRMHRRVCRLIRQAAGGVFGSPS